MKKENKKVFDTESFIRECILKFGNDRFDYSKVEYVSAKQEVLIRCIKHDLWFEVQPYTHRSGNGSCPKCRSEGCGQYNKLSVKDFIDRANTIHHNKYDYSLVKDFKNAHTKVSIVCPTHGTFEQTVSNHLYNGFGCNECAATERGLKSRLSQEEVLVRFKSSYGDRFDYSDVVYTTIYDQVKIYCKEHDHWFMQTPNDHFKGVGCVYCANKAKSLGNIGVTRGIKTTKQFIESAVGVHGDLYDYSLTEYSGITNNVNIVCKQHGVFSQHAGRHLEGRGCPACGKIKSSLSNRTTLQEFKDYCTLVHEGRYDYSLVDFETLQDKIVIICAEHGKFLQKAQDHKCGKGCKRCASAGGYDPNKSGYFYILSVREDTIKFGITCNLQDRVKTINDYSVYDIRVLHEFFFEDGKIPQVIESEVKKSLDIKSVIPRNEMYQGHTETTHLSNLPKILEIVQRHTPA